MEDMDPGEFYASIVGAFIATLIACFFSLQILETEQLPVLLASTGASAVLIFAFPHAPVSQPWNLVGGHVICAFIGVSCYKLIPHILLGAGLAIPIAMVAMHFLRCMHPPGGATAITAIIGGPAVYELGYAFLIVPVFFNAIILLSIALSIGTFRKDNPFAPTNDANHFHNYDELPHHKKDL